MLAAVACGEYPSVKAAADAIVRVVTLLSRSLNLWNKYEKKYRQFAAIYPAVKGLFTQWAQE